MVVFTAFAQSHRLHSDFVCSVIEVRDDVGIKPEVVEQGERKIAVDGDYIENTRAVCDSVLNLRNQLLGLHSPPAQTAQTWVLV